jgi:hypothetical protein
MAACDHHDTLACYFGMRQPIRTHIHHQARCDLIADARGVRWDGMESWAMNEKVCVEACMEGCRGLPLRLPRSVL